MEDEERLEAEIISPIQQSQIFEEVGRDKCDAAVVLQFAEVSSVCMHLSVCWPFLVLMHLTPLVSAY